MTFGLITHFGFAFLLFSLKAKALVNIFKHQNINTIKIISKIISNQNTFPTKKPNKKQKLQKSCVKNPWCY